MNFFEKCDIESAIREIERILADGKLQNPSIQCADKKADFTLLMINLRDLLSKTEKFACRINSTDDVIPMWQGTRAEVLDVTSLVTCFRDAMCHPDSFRHEIGARVKLTFGTQTYGDFVARDFEDFKSPTCDYEDDFMFVCGPQRIYFQRHIVSAFSSAKNILLPILEKFNQFDVQTGVWNSDSGLEK